MKMQSKLSAMAALCLALSLTLSACGGSDATAEDPNAPVVSMIDAFTRFVTSFISGAPDDQEPQATDTVAVTVPDETEPAVVN